MKSCTLILFLLHCVVALSQKDKGSKIVRDQYNVQGNTTINNYYIRPPSKGEKRQKLIDATVGYFSKAKNTTANNVILRFGSNYSEANRKGDISFGEPVDPIRVTKKKGQINIQANVRDSRGDVYAKLSGNSWEITNKAGIEYNNDGSAFEILTGSRVVFQIQIVKDTVIYYGMICNEGGWCMFQTPTTPFEPLRKGTGTQRFVLPKDFLLKPLFKYPRYEHLGVRNNDK